MKKNSYKKAPKNIKPLVTAIVLLIIIGICFKAVSKLLVGSDIFRIKKISYPRGIEFSKDSGVFGLIGKNLFSLDTKVVSQKIRQEFPQLNKVRILKRLPDEVIIEAFKRNPVALVNLGGKYLYVDFEGAISSSNNRQERLPVILGVVNRPVSLRIGQTYDDRNLRFALEIIQEVDKIPYLKKVSIAKVNVVNLNRASFMLSNGIEVIIGEERLKDKLQLLLIVISRLGKEFEQAKYIDLRFKEPAIGRK